MVAVAVTDQLRLDELEETIETGMDTVLEVGRALLEIRDAGLYKVNGFASFDAYVKDRWDFGKSHAYRLMDASKTHDRAIKASPMGDKLKTERQLRELVNVPDSKLAEVLDRASDIADDETVKASDIKKAREEIIPPAPKPAPQQKPVPKLTPAGTPNDAVAQKAKASIPELVRKLLVAIGNSGIIPSASDYNSLATTLMKISRDANK